jgi:DNA helicase-2/ATP-dependent DNA helicase PcrA
MSDTKVFHSIYKKLNIAQKKAVDTVEGPVMVIAGPGTGKTTILTLRIANILRETDTDPDSILALTFTESGVYSMRKKLVEIIGSTGYKVNIHTFHSFANNIIKRNPDDFPRIIGSEHAAEIEQIKIFEEIFNEGEFSLIRPYGDPLYYLKPSLNSIRKLKMENVRPDDFEEKIAKEEEALNRADDLYHDKGRFAGQMKGKYKTLARDIEKNKDLYLVYKQYEEKLSERNLYDYEDMLLEVISTLENNNDLRLRLQEKYHYILADEHQDANFAQNRILELLSRSAVDGEGGGRERPNLFIVGDEKQAIFRFQGASLDNFLYFKDMFPDAEILALTDNYRSTQTILDSAHSLISESGDGKDVPRERLIAKGASGAREKTIEIYDLKNPSLERSFIAKDIKERINKRTLPSEIAVLYRDNRDAFLISDVLERMDIPFVIESNVDIFSDEDITKIVLLMRAVTEPINDEYLLKTLHLDFLGIEPVDAHKIANARREKRTKAISLLKDEKALKESGVDDVESALKFGKMFRSWITLSSNKRAEDAFEIIVRESGFLTHILSLPESVQKISKLDRIFSEISEAGRNHRDFKLKDFMDYLDMLEIHNILISSSEEVALQEAVRLMTAHRSKGLEFKVVYITGAVDGHWGNRRRAELFRLPVKGLGGGEDEADDERRLFYVALTRAKEEVIITYSRTTEEGKHQLRSQFIEEIEERFRNDIDTANVEKDFEGQKFYFEPKKERGPGISQKEYLNEKFLEQGLSVTALNNYLSCPWKYFFENLIRIPKAPNKFQGYGIAIHEALFFYFEKIRKDGKAEVENALEVFEKALGRQTLSDADYEELLEKGKTSLSGYVEKYGQENNQNIFNEYDVAGVYLPIHSDQSVLLKGKLDKVEIGESGVTVYDYKTSKPKTKNYILGKTKNSNGEYWRQLVFYKMLLDRLLTSSWNMKAGVIDFVEPDNKGRYKREVFEVKEEDVAELEKEIKGVSEEILNLQFWNNTCDDPNCEYCELRKMMKK